jgi:beta-glucanase (GH16 family)
VGGLTVGGNAGRWRRVGLSLAALLLLGSIGWVSGLYRGRHLALPALAKTSAPRRSRAHWVLTWHDEFRGHGRPKGWTFAVGGYDAHLKQLQWYDARSAVLDGHGHLVITAHHDRSGYTCWYGPCRYTSARLQPSPLFSQTYGKFEARIKIPPGLGLWPAFWLKPVNVRGSSPSYGEIDIIEKDGRKPDIAAGYAHAFGHHHQADLVLARPLSARYHVYGLLWTAKEITWTIDGRPYSHMRAYPGWPFDRPFFLTLDLAVGGAWPGPPGPDTRFPAHMDVDWVRVYRQTRKTQAH